MYPRVNFLAHAHLKWVPWIIKMNPEKLYWMLMQKETGVIAGYCQLRGGSPVFESIIEKTVPKKDLEQSGWSWKTSGRHMIYTFYKREVPTIECLKLIGKPKTYEDVGGHFEDHLHALFYDWKQLYDIIVAILPQPIAEEIVPEIEWKNTKEYIKIVDRDKKTLEYYGLRKCPRS